MEEKLLGDAEGALGVPREIFLITLHHRETFRSRNGHKNDGMSPEITPWAAHDKALRWSLTSFQGFVQCQSSANISAKNDCRARLTIQLVLVYEEG